MKGKNADPLPEVELPDENELPEGWKTSPLLEISELIRGVSYKKGEESQSCKTGFVPLLRANNIDQELKFENILYVPEKYVKTKQFLQQGDVLFAMSSGSKSVVGKAATVKNKWDGTFGAFCGVLRPSNRVDWNFFGYFFQTRYYRDRISKASAGVNINNLKREYFEAIDFPLPPLPEQQRIVARIEALLTNINAARERLHRVPLIMKKFRQAVLAAACEGRLTEGWREGHSDEPPACELVQQIKNSRDAQKILNLAKKLKTIHKSELEDCQEDSIEIPDSWTLCQIQDITQVQLGGTPSRKEPSYWGGEISWISSGEVANNRIQSTRERITDIGLKNSNAKLYPKGTVLIAMIGEGKTRGQSAILDIDATTNQNVAGLVFDTDKIFNEFVWLWSLSQYEKTRAIGRGGEQPALNGEKVRNLTLALPPLAEQHEIVRRVEALFARADAVEREVAAATKRADALTQAVLAKAFAGKL